jgi:hypothetical protein
MKRSPSVSFSDPYKFARMHELAGAWQHSEWTAGASEPVYGRHVGDERAADHDVEQLPLAVDVAVGTDAGNTVDAAGAADAEVNMEADADPLDEDEVMAGADEPLWTAPAGHRWSKRWAQLPDGSFRCRWALVRVAAPAAN